MTPGARRGTLARTWRTLASDAGTWLLALMLALGLWFFVNAGAKASERTLRVRLDLANLPTGMVITSAVPEYVEIRASGSGLLLSSIDAKDLRTTLDLSGVRPGVATFTLNTKHFALPRNVEVTRATPSQVNLSIDRIARRSLPVRLETQGELQPGLRMTQAMLLPDTVEVAGPRSRVGQLRQVQTQPIDLASLEPGVDEREVELLHPGGLVQLRVPQVRAHLVVDREVDERAFERVPVEVRNAKPGWKVEPERIRVVVEGPSEDLGRLELGEGAAYIDATEMDGPGPHRVSPRVALPPGYRVVRLEPPEVTLTLEAKADRTDSGGGRS